MDAEQTSKSIGRFGKSHSEQAKPLDVPFKPAPQLEVTSSLHAIKKIPSAGIVVPEGKTTAHAALLKTIQPISVPGGPANSIKPSLHPSD